jgi:DNA-binding XRE family transcriptional regulator
MPKRQEAHQAFYEEVGRRIREARKRRTPALTQDELARLVGLTRTSITNVEQGRQKCLLHTLAEIATALQVEVATLIPVFASPPADLDDVLSNRPASEKEWIIATVNAATKGITEHGT